MKKPKNNWTRRDFIQTGALILGGLPFLRVPQKFLNSQPARAQSDPWNVVDVLLTGAWSSSEATDPLVGSKRSSNAYSAELKALATAVVPGKANLVVGAGLIDAVPTFQQYPTAFVNGLDVVVTAHELGQNYMISGVLSLSRSREFAALVPLIASASQNFPSHLVLGNRVPLADTANTHPPLMASASNLLTNVLAGPYTNENFFQPESLRSANRLIATLNGIKNNRLPAAALQALQPWKKSDQSTDVIYENRFFEQVIVTPQMMTDYGSTGNPFGMGALLASAFVTLRSGMTNKISISMQTGLDTHTSHLPDHVDILKRFCTALNRFMADLSVTPDPKNPALMLSQTTTLRIISDFVRTPRLNLADGTDHWPSGSCIFIGKGIRDNTRIGATGDDALPMGWQNGVAVSKTSQTALLPDHIVAGFLNKLGYGSIANTISLSPNLEVFI